MKRMSALQFFTAIVEGWLGMHLEGWQLEVNVLNLRRATINELSHNSSYYMSNSKKFGEFSHEQFMEILTHWNEEGNGVDIDIGEAIAEVLQSKLVIYTIIGDSITHMPRSSCMLQTVMIREEQDGKFVPVERDTLPIVTDEYSEDQAGEVIQEINSESFK